MHRTAVAALIVLLTTPLALDAQQSPYFGDLKKGPHGVGYRTFTRTDYARATRPKRDFRGNPVTVERGRTITFNVWYPAVQAGGKKMTFEDYSHVARRTAPTDSQRKVVRDAFVARFAPGGAKESDLLRLMDMPVEAVFEAKAAAGRFPMLIGINPGRNAGEYLASHGYVVVAVMMNGDFAQIELVNTIEFALNEMRADSSVDFSRIAAAGFSFGGGIATLTQLKTNNIDAVVSFDGVEAWPQSREQITVFPFWRPQDADVPYLRFHDEDRAAADVDWGMLYDRAPHMDFIKVGYRELGHRPLEGAISNHLVPGFDGENPPRSLQYHRLMGEYMLHFLNAVLKGDSTAAAWLRRTPEQNGFEKDLATVTHRPARPRAPSQIEAAEVIEREGIEKFRQLYAELRKRDPEPMNRQALTNLMLSFGSRANAAKARVMAQLLTSTYPTLSSVSYNSANTMINAGDSTAAATYYRQALERMPADTVTTTAQKDRMKRMAEEFLNGFGR